MAQDRTTSLDLPPVLSQLLGPMTPPVTQTPTTQQQFNPAASGLSSGMTQPQQMSVPSYAVGGMVGAGGMPDMSGAGMPGAVGVQPQTPQTTASPQQIEMAVQQFMNNYPDRVAEIQRVIVAGMQDGTLSMQDMNMMEQMAMTAMQNPEMYPNVRQLAIQQGFATEQDLPQQYEPAVIFSVLVAAQIAKQVQAGMGGAGGAGSMQVPAMGQAVSPAANFAMGGMVDDKTVTPGEMAAGGGNVVGPGTGTSDSVPIRVSTGEYVIPAHVVKMKGKEFFDSMLEKYKDSE